MELVFLVFFVFAVLSYFAETEQADCRVYKHSNMWFLTSWNPRHIYNYRVCLKFNEPIENCSRASESFVALNIKHSSGTEVLRSNFFTPADVNGRFCAIFDACRIAKAVEGKYITGSELMVSAEVFAFKEVLPDQEPLSMYGQSDTRVRARLGTITNLTHELLSIQCFVPDCTIQSEGYGGDAKQYFTRGEKDRAPKCVEEGGRTTPGAFSITQFLCDPNCTRNYTAYSSPIDFPPRPKDCLYKKR